jgi:aspartate/methionine/tyrosine aminotransferase
MRDHISQRARAVEIAPQTSLATQDLINLASGTPDFAPPTFIVDAMVDSLRSGKMQYTAWSGMPELRRAIAAKLERENGFQADPANEILVTSGAQEALMTVLMTILDPGDEVLIADPHYGVYTRAAKIAGATMVRVPTTRAEGFVPTVASIEAALTPRSKAIIVVSPSNPTGAVFDRESLLGILDLARRHDLLVISDEIYEHYLFDGAEHVSFAALPGAHERTITINSLSKGYALTGIRVGYIVAPAALIHAMLPFHHAMTICAPVTAQHGAIAALSADRDWFVPILAEYDRRRQLWMETLERAAIPYARPRGAYYIAVDVSSFGLPLATFIERARTEAGLLLGAGGGGLLRGSLMQTSPRLDEGLSRLATFATSLR